MHVFKFIDLSQSYILKKNGFTIHLTCLAKNIQNTFSNDHKYLSNLKIFEGMRMEGKSFAVSPAFSYLLHSSSYSFKSFFQPLNVRSHARHVGNYEDQNHKDLIQGA